MCNAMRRSDAMSVLLSGWLLLLPAFAGAATLSEAQRAFDDNEYLTAQTLLLDVDVDALSDDELDAYEQLMGEVADAIAGAERGQQDFAAAEAEFDAGRWDAASELYNRVLDNRFAPGELQAQAVSRLKLVEEKRDLEQAARPDGPIDPEPMIIEMEATPDPLLDTPAPVGGPRRLSLVDQARLRDQLFWQRALARFNELRDETNAAIAADDFTIAVRNAALAVQVIEANRQYAEPVARYEAALNEAQRLQDRVQRENRAYERRQAAVERDAIRVRIAESKRIQEQQRTQFIESLFLQVDVLREERRCDEAVEICRQILELDPDNLRATYELKWADNCASYQDQYEQHDLMSERTREALIDADAALIPTGGWISYPENWIEMLERRGQLGRQEIVEEFVRRQRVEERLQRLSPLEQPYENLTFDEILERMRDDYQIDIRANELQLEDFGLDFGAPITIERRGRTIQEILQEAIDQAATAGFRPNIDYGPGFISIVPDGEESTFGRQYDILSIIPRDPIQQQQQQIQFDQIGGQSLLGDQEQEDWDELSDRIIEDIVPVIEAGIAPRFVQNPSWALQPVPRRYLLATTTYEGHKQVEALVASLGFGLNGPKQAAFEARFLIITSNFLEQIGVDLDFVFNSATAGYDYATGADGSVIRNPFSGSPVLIPRQQSLAGFYPTVPAVGTPFTPGVAPTQPYGQAGFVPQSPGVVPNWGELTPVPVQNNSLDLVNPNNLVTGVPGSLASATDASLTIAGSFLDNLQVDFLIRATQASRRSSVVQAPRLLVAEDEQARIQIGRQFDYVASLEAVAGDGAAVLEPEIEEVEQGITMELAETEITSSLKYVVTRIGVQQSGEPLRTTFTVQRASGNSPGSFVTLVDQDVNQIITKISIPDGGTVLLGGLKRAGEGEAEAGVPVLSKIPILKRAFTNTSMVKDTQTIFILLKASIIVPEEAEAEAFPVLTTAGETGGVSY